MPRLFFLLSGEHATLPLAELKGALEAGEFEYEEVLSLPQVSVMDVDEKCATVIASRCSMTKLCCTELFYCKAEEKEIYANIRKVNARGSIKPNQTFEVRVKRVQASSPELKTELLEREIGKIMLEAVPGTKVDLENPDKTFLGVLSGGMFVFGLKLAEVSRKPFYDRGPRRRPYFHPSTISPKLARCLVNMARAKAGQLLLDPFCGAGGILIEGGLLGCKVIGLDVEEEMTRGALQNLHYYGIDPLGTCIADARRLPFKRADVIVTDPPYGRCSTTLRLSTKQLLLDFLREAYKILPRGGFVCLASPREVDVSQIGKEVKFRVVERHILPVHGGLTREIALLKRG